MAQAVILERSKLLSSITLAYNLQDEQNVAHLSQIIRARLPGLSNASIILNAINEADAQISQRQLCNPREVEVALYASCQVGVSFHLETSLKHV